MKERKSRKPWILGTLAVLVVAVIALVVYEQKDKKQKEEVWAFRDTLDKTYFPFRDEYESCVYPKKDSKKYDCYKMDLTERSEKLRERINNYEVSSDDAKNLKNEVLNGIDIIDKTSKDLDVSEQVGSKKGKLSADEVADIADNTSNLMDDKEAFFKNAEKIYDILVPKYYSKD
ncbi:hypothetical protein SAMN05428981_11012 [Bacillus sp. OV194]|nr:hypothetical protein SAMN05428981_11012 [Bacillus sp. OV194]